jgi:lipid-A-disaccharide synthase
MKRRILLLAGEESGLIYARRIEAELKKRHGEGVEVRGYADYGFRTSDLAVMGFWPVLRRIFYFLGVKRTMERVIREWRPDAVCTVDYPGMNLKLAAYAKSLGIRAVHVVCPQVWAWKAGRIPKIEAGVDRLCCFFPFEPELFRPGFAEFVGHPLAEEFSLAEDRRRGREEGVKTLAVLPGSRMGEIAYHLPTMLEAVKRLREKRQLRVVIPAANEKALCSIREMVSAAGADSIEVVAGGARELLGRADFAVVASGTATLEAALANCPTVLVYRVGALLAWFARRVIKGIRHVGLANIIAEKAGVPCPMPELLQEDFTAGNVVRELEMWLDGGEELAKRRKMLSETVKLLGSGGGSMVKIADMLD